MAPGGGIFVGGGYDTALDLGSGVVTPNPAYGSSAHNVFLAKLDEATLDAAWVATFPGPQSQTVTSFAANGAGQLGVVGPLTSGAMFVGGQELDHLYPGDQFIVAADERDGSGLWAKRVNLQNQAPDSREVGLWAIAGDPLGEAFMICGAVACGTGPSSGDAGPNPNPAHDLSPDLFCKGGTDLVVARLHGGSVGTASATQDGGTTGIGGEVVWADDVGGVNDEYCSGLAIDSASGAYVVGTYRFGSTVSFGNLASLPVVDNANEGVWMFIAKSEPDPADATGNAYRWVWSSGIGVGAETFTPQAIMTSSGTSSDAGAPRQDVVVAGAVANGTSFSGVVSNGTSFSATMGLPSSSAGLDGGSANGNGATTFIARFDGSTGDLLWVSGLGAGTPVSVKSLAEEGGVILVTGTYGPACTACTLGAIPLSVPGTGGAFIAQIDPGTGAVKGAKGFGMSGYGNSGAGVVGLDLSTGASQGSLLLLTFTSAIDLGLPVGVVHGGGADGGASGGAGVQSCLARIGP